MKNLYTFLILVFTILAANAQVINIPDVNFRNELIYTALTNNVAKNSAGVTIRVDANNNNQIEVSEALNVYQLVLSNDTYYSGSIQSLEGLQYFTNLRYFKINYATSINVPVSFTTLTNIQTIDINGCAMIGTNGINVSGLLNLNTLNCNNCNLVSVNLTGLTGLINVDVSTNDLTGIDLTGLPNLKKVDIHGNIITNPTFLVDAINTIEDLNIASTRLTTFNSAIFHSLKYLDCSSHYYLTGLNLQNYTNLIKLTSNGTVHTNSANFFNLAGCTNLQELYCNDNYISAISLQGLTGLKTVELKSTRLSSIDFSSLSSIENIDVSFTPNSGPLSINVQGCTTLKKLICYWAHLTTLNVSNLTNLEILDCGYNTSLSSVNLTNCTGLKYATFYSTQMTSLDMSSCYNLLELDAHANNSLTNLNLRHCIALKKINCNGCAALPLLDLSCSSSYTEIRFKSCTNLQTVNLKNGILDTPIFEQGFNTNLTLIAVDFNEHFSIFGASVNQSPYYTFTPNCTYNTILGNVKFDFEGDGCQNNQAVAGVRLDYNNVIPGWYTFSDDNGNFTIYSQSNPVNVTPSNVNSGIWNFGVALPIVMDFTPTNNLLNLNLCFTPLGVHNDLEVTILPLDITRPGFDSYYKIVYKNKGNQIQSGNVNIQFDDSKMDLVSATPASTSQTFNNLNWTFSNLLPFEVREIYATFNINTPIELPAVNGGDILNFRAVISPTIADDTPNDNVAVFNEVVVNSFDPNNKTCLEGGTIATNMIGDYVHYIVRFENNGTANAHNVVVRDVIDTTKLDITSLRPIDSSHNVFTRVDNANVVEFIFENINLPFDDAHNDGFIAFKIKTKSTLVVGNTFSNTANIYFDYNAPILTNTTTTTVVALGTEDFEFNNLFSLSPVPAKNVLTITPKQTVSINSISIYNTLGQLVQVNTSPNEIIDVSGLKAGNYFIKIITDKGTAGAKFVKQ